MNIKDSIVFLMSLLAVLTCVAQEKDEESKRHALGGKSRSLLMEILHQDSALFTAFNSCDSVIYKKYFTTDLEFFHDIGGLTVSLESEMKSFYEMCARATKVRRELVKTDIEVYPIGSYGAVQIGSHRFYFTNTGQKERLGGIYKFVHVWQLKGGAWKISRVISYGHK